MTATLTRTSHDYKTLADLLAVPDDGIERWLVDGEIVEIGSYETFTEGTGMTMRNKQHGWLETRIAQHLANWNDELQPPRGRVYSGQIGVRLARIPDIFVGIDVIYLTPEMFANQIDDDDFLIDGPPLLAVEIISPSDTTKRINDKIRLFQKHGVELIWIVDPYSKTLSIPRKGMPPLVFTEEHELVGDPHLPGFRIAVKKFFA